jgi:hypothetical protein
MSEKKEYTPREAAIAVLKKAEELLLKNESARQGIVNESKHGTTLPKSEEAQDEVKETQDPSLNPKEMAGSPGTNEEWGTSPKTYSTLKLARFLGHLESKRSSKKKVSK